MAHRSSPAQGTPLEERWRRALRSVVSASGEKVACAALDIPRTTLARALAGLGLRRATADVLMMRLSALASGEMFDRQKFDAALRETLERQPDKGGAS